MSEYKFTNQNDNMLFRLINDVYKALDAEAYMAALITALSIIDVCSKAEYPGEEHVGPRYIKWFDEEIGITERPDYSDMDQAEAKLFKDMPYLNGEVIYQLRCALVHQGNPNIDNKKDTAPEHKIDHFIIEFEKPKSISIFGDSASYNHDSGEKTYKVNLNGLCYKICAVAKGYYKRNPQKFNFFEYELIDKDERLSQFFKA